MGEMERELFQRCSAGDADAWNRLISVHAPLVYAVARKQGLREDECDDVAQSVFSMLVRRIAQIRDAQALPAWLITTTKREAWRVRRTAARAASGGEEQEPASLDESAERLDVLHRLRLGLEDLGGRCKELLTLLYLAEPTPNYEIVSKSLGMPVGSIGPTRARCLGKLAEILKDL